MEVEPMEDNSIAYATDFLIRLQSLLTSSFDNLINKSKIVKIIESETDLYFAEKEKAEKEKIKYLCVDFFDSKNKDSIKKQNTVLEIAKILDS